jgi:hypothetical protein
MVDCGRSCVLVDLAISYEGERRTHSTRPLQSLEKCRFQHPEGDVPEAGDSSSVLVFGGRLIEEIHAWLRLDEGDLDAVQRPGMGEDDSAFREV